MDCLCLNETPILLLTKAWEPVCNRQRSRRMSEKQYLLDIVLKTTLMNLQHLWWPAHGQVNQHSRMKSGKTHDS